MFFLVAGTFRGEEGRQGIDKGGSGGGGNNKSHHNTAMCRMPGIVLEARDEMVPPLLSERGGRAHRRYSDITELKCLLHRLSVSLVCIRTARFWCKRVPQVKKFV